MGILLSYFDEQRVVTRKNIIEQKSIFGVSAIRDLGTGTVNNADGEYSLENQGDGDVTILQSAERGPYAPGFDLEPGAAIRTLTKPVGGSLDRAGYFDEDDGLFLEYHATGAGLVRRRKGSDTPVAVGTWDGEILKLTGIGSGKMDPRDGHAYQFPLSWYGFGPLSLKYQLRVRNAITGRNLRRLARASVRGQTTLANPHLPSRIEVRSGAGDPARTIHASGRQICVVGDYDLIWRPTTFKNAKTVDDTAWVWMGAIKRGSIKPYALTKPNELDVISSDSVEIALEENNATPAGTFSRVDGYNQGETFLVANSAPGSTFGEGNRLSQPIFPGGGKQSQPSGSDDSFERTPLIEDRPLLIWAKKVAGGGSSQVTIAATFREDY